MSEGTQGIADCQLAVADWDVAGAETSLVACHFFKYAKISLGG
jgi:hypothetical protein